MGVGLWLEPVKSNIPGSSTSLSRQPGKYIWLQTKIGKHPPSNFQRGWDEQRWNRKLEYAHPSLRVCFNVCVCEPDWKILWIFSLKHVTIPCPITSPQGFKMKDILAGKILLWNLHLILPLAFVVTVNYVLITIFSECVKPKIEVV